MKKSYIFLLVSLFSITFITFILKDDYENVFLDETEKEIKILHKERDSVFSIAKEVLSGISEEKKNNIMLIDSLNGEIENKESLINKMSIGGEKRIPKKVVDVPSITIVDKTIIKKIVYDTIYKQIVIKDTVYITDTIFVTDTVRVKRKKRKRNN